MLWKRCSIWPSSLYLSEFILSFPEIFSNKFCFEVKISHLYNIIFDILLLPFSEPSFSHHYWLTGRFRGWFGGLMSGSCECFCSKFWTSLDLIIAKLEGLWFQMLKSFQKFQVILSDGDLSTLANMKLNLESNLQQSGVKIFLHLKLVIFLQTWNPGVWHSLNSFKVQCICLPWETATENELQSYAPHIV